MFASAFWQSCLDKATISLSVASIPPAGPLYCSSPVVIAPALVMTPQVSIASNFVDAKEHPTWPVPDSEAEGIEWPVYDQRKVVESLDGHHSTDATVAVSGLSFCPCWIVLC